MITEEIVLDVNTDVLDVTIAKMERLVELLREAKQLTDSLFNQNN